MDHIYCNLFNRNGLQEYWDLRVIWSYPCYLIGHTRKTR